MVYSMWKGMKYLPIWGLLFLLGIPVSGFGQQTEIPEKAADTTQMDTLVIRAEQLPIKIIPRGYRLRIREFPLIRPNP